MPRRAAWIAKLVGPAGLRPEPQPGAVRRRQGIQPLRTARAVIASRAPGVRGSTALTTPVRSARVSQSVQVSSAGSPSPVGRVVPSSSRCRARLDDRPVFLDDPPLLELRGEPAGGLGRLGPDQDPGGRPVEPVDDPQVDRAGIGRIEILPDRRFQRDLAGRRPCPLGELARRLDDGQAMRRPRRGWQRCWFTQRCSGRHAGDR